jgi:hypothetical protein
MFFGVRKIFSLLRDIISVGGDFALLSLDILDEFILGLNLSSLLFCQRGIEISEDLDEGDCTPVQPDRS